MGRALGNIMKMALMAGWVVLCWYFCGGGKGTDWLVLWVVCGLPFGTVRFWKLLKVKGFGIAGGLGVLALSIIAGGIAGGIVLAVRFVKLLTGTCAALFGQSAHKCEDFSGETGWETERGYR